MSLSSGYRGNARKDIYACGGLKMFRVIVTKSKYCPIIS